MNPINDDIFRAKIISLNNISRQIKYHQSMILFCPKFINFNPKQYFETDHKYILDIFNKIL